MIAVCVSGAVCPTALFAQTQLPAGDQPGRIERRFAPPRTPQSLPEATIPETQEQLPPEQADRIRFVLSGVAVEGATVYAESDFLKLYRDRIGNEITLTDVYRLADAITAMYRNDGYILSRAVVPPQRIVDGIVHLRIVEGRIGQVIVEGDVGNRGALFREMGERIKQSVPLNNKVLERYSLLANDMPGVKARAVLRPSRETPGASDVVFSIERTPVEAMAAFDNRGSRTSGPREYTLGGGLNSILGLYEKTTVNWINTTEAKELRYLSVQHDEILNEEGTKLSLSGNRSRGEPGESLRDLDERTRNVTLGLTLSHPLIRSRQENLSVSAGVAHKNSRTEQLGEVATDDRIRLLRLGSSYDYSDAWDGVNLIAVDLYQGLDVMNATPFGAQDKSRARGRSDFTHVNVDISRTQQLDGGFSLLAAATGQYAATALLSAEEFGFGGAQFGRAYDSSEITGDSGAAAKLELQYTNRAEEIGITYYQPFIFYDYGVTHDRDPINQEATRTGTSAGIGVRFGLFERFTGSLELDRPLTRPVSTEVSRGDGKDARIFFSLMARY